MPRSTDPGFQFASALGFAFLLYSALDGLLGNYLGEQWPAPVASLALLLLLYCVRASQRLPDGYGAPRRKSAVMLATRMLLALLAFLSARLMAAQVLINDPAVWLVTLSPGAIILLVRFVREIEMEGLEADLREGRTRRWFAIRALMCILAAVFSLLTSPIGTEPSFTRWYALGVTVTATLGCLYELFFIPPPPQALPVTAAIHAAD